MIRYLRTPLDWPIALFLVSALIGVWASYDPATSWRKFALIVAAILLYYILVAARAIPQLLEIFVWLFLLGCCALTLYFVTQHDYEAQPGKFGFITAIGLYLNAIAPQLSLHVFDPNITAGALEIALPINIALVIGQKWTVDNRRSLFTVYCSLFTGLVIVFGLVMTSSRGAWLALGIVGTIAFIAVVARDVLRRYALPIGVIAALAVLIVVIRSGEAFVPTLESILGAIPAGDTAISRIELLGQAWGLVQDYYFTGSGLGVFPMVLSTYALLIDVPFLTHVHNLFLQIWLEQGLLGFVAFAWLIVEFYLWCRRTGTSKRIDTNERTNWLFLGGVAAVTVVLLHGTVDVLLYSSRGLPLVFVPFGIAIASEQSTVNSQQSTVNAEQFDAVQKLKGVKRQSKIGVIVLAVLALLFTVYYLLFTGNALAAMWFANIGSVEQTKVELGQYHWPDHLAGNIRKDQSVSNLQSPISNFQHALALDAGNVTANQRLAAIALAQGNWDDARQLLGRAYWCNPSSQVTNRLLRLVSNR